MYLMLYIGKIRVKCNQTGKLFNVKVTALCKEDGDPVQRDNLVVGAQLIMTLNKKSYPVTLQKIITPLELQTDSKFFIYICPWRISGCSVSRYQN